MKCPTCGQPLARLADPCLHCAAVLSGRGQASATAAPGPGGPTSLTLPAELRVPEATAPVPVTPAGTVPGPSAGGPHHLGARTVPSRPPQTQPAAAASEAIAARQALPVSMPPEPRRTLTRAARRTGAVAGAVLLGLIVAAGLQRHRDALPGTADARPIVASPAAPAPAASPIASDAVLSTSARREPAPMSVRPSTAPIVAALRPKGQAPIAGPTGAATPAASSSPVVDEGDAPVSSHRSAESLPQAALEPVWPDPREACGSRGFIARALCINERCARPSFAGHAECIKLRKAAEEAELAVQRGG